MKFLGKAKSSIILIENLTYRKGADNSRLRNLLLEEQKHFCAYTEKYEEDLDSFEVEHFNSAIKYEDDYYNYYSVLGKANKYKKDEKYPNAPFFKTLFFHDINELNKRIRYIEGVYEEINKTDSEAKDFIDFIGLNDYSLYQQRNRHIERIKDTLAAYTPDEQVEYFRKYKTELSFITALEIALQLDLSEFYQ